jgi:all-trans-retinol 13,14-reductase
MTIKNKKAIVIGSGAGGLMAAAYLSKYGFEVTALEQALHLGGYLNSFSLKSYHFDPGIHYMGECHEGRMVHQMMTRLGIDADDMFCEMDPDGFDIYRFPDFEIRMCRGIEKYKDRLMAQFPDEVQGINRFFKVAVKMDKAMQKLTPYMYRTPKFNDITNLMEMPVLMPSIMRWGLKDYGSVLNWVTDNVQLKAVLSAVLGCIGLPPSKVSVFMALGVFLHFINGSFFPKGGGGGLRDAIVKSARDNGAVFRTRSPVKQILLQNGKARGVVLQNGELLEADVIISAIEPAITFGQLIEMKDLPPKLRRKIIRTEPSLGSFYVFLGLKKDLAKHDLTASNLWKYYTYDMDSLYQPALEGKISQPAALIISPNSLKDTSKSLAPRDCSTLEIMTFVAYEPFSRWDGLKSYKRGKEYDDLKNTIGEDMIEQVKKAYPGLISDVEVKNFATPVTNSFWVNAVKGGAYGPAMSKQQTMHGRFTSRTPFQNLFLAGSGVFGCGVATCFMSGIIAANLAKKG